MFQYSPESFTGTEVDFAVEVCDAVNAIWEPTPENPSIINLPSTVEMATPNIYADQVELFCRNIKNRDSVIVSLHTHNDRSCAVGAAELAVMGGAQRVEGTLLGNGERTGNMDIVVMAMNLYSQGVDPGLDLHDMDRIVSVVRECTQIDVHPRQAYSGDLVFTAFSGSHQDAIKKCLDSYKEGSPWEIAYLPIDPRDIGRTYQDVIRVNSQSGKGGVAYVLANKFGFQLPRWLQIEFSQVIQRTTETTGGEINPDEIWDLFNKHYLQNKKVISLENFRLEKQEGRESFTAQIDYFGKEIPISGQGDGVLDALVEALKNLGITFLFAPSWHPSLVNLAPLRKSLGVRTIFNLLGPLVNPLRPKSQVLGVAKADLLDPMSVALKGMGLKRAVVVHGAGGLDEASLAGANQFRFLDKDVIRSEIINPSDLGLTEISNESLKGDDLKTNSQILMSLLMGEGNKYHKEVVALNTALVLWVSGAEDDLSLGVKRSLDCLNTDKSWLLFKQLRDFLAT